MSEFSDVITNLPVRIDMAYHLLRFLLKVLAYMPFWLLYGLSAIVYVLLYYVLRYRREIVRRNLTECFPEKSLDEIKRIERRFYHNFADNIIETVKMGSMSDEEMSRRMNFTNIEDIDTSLRAGKSIALFLGHYFNWEWISSMPIRLYKGAVAAQIYHKLSNPNIDRLMLESRASHGAVNVEMRKTARFITHLASEGKVCIVGFIADQSPKRKDIQLYLPFLNHKTPAQAVTEKIARHYEMEAWFVDVRKVKRGYYEVEFVPISKAPESLPEHRLTEMYYRMLEQIIRRDPSCYLWSHRRFRNAELL